LTIPEEIQLREKLEEKREKVKEEIKKNKNDEKVFHKSTEELSPAENGKIIIILSHNFLVKSTNCTNCLYKLYQKRFYFQKFSSKIRNFDDLFFIKISVRNFNYLARIWISDQSFDFGPIFSIFDQNFYFRPKFLFLANV